MISVIIPTYKNTEVLISNLKHNLPYLEGCEVIVVNDDPKQSIGEALSPFIQVKLIENKVNKGFSGAVNIGVEAATGDFIMLLNNDVKLLNNSYLHALEHFKSDHFLFAVSFAQKEFDGSIVGKNEIYFEKGFFNHRKAPNFNFGINAWAEGGSALFDRIKFRRLRGFDEQYSPFYWEDVDLSYRAWKKGYSILFDPKIVVEHHHETTISSQFSKESIKAIAYRNQLIFNWKHCGSLSMIAAHKFYLIKMLVRAVFTHDTVFLEGWFQASKRFFTILKSRATVSHLRSDHEILARFTHK